MGAAIAINTNLVLANSHDTPLHTPATDPHRSPSVDKEPITGIGRTFNRCTGSEAEGIRNGGQLLARAEVCVVPTGRRAAHGDLQPTRSATKGEN